MVKGKPRMRRENLGEEKIEKKEGSAPRERCASLVGR